MKDRFYLVDVRVEGDRIQDIDVKLQPKEGEKIKDLTGKMLLPGLTDMHFHGCMGYDTCDGTLEAIEAIASYEADHGITQIVPTTMTYPEERLRAPFEAAKAYDNSHAQLVGLHMEGPYISHEKIGAQNPAYVMTPDVEMTRRLDELSGGLLKVVSIAPEVEGALGYGDALGDSYILSVAHTNADYDMAKEAYQRGYSHLTHMFNAMKPIHHRAPGVIPAALEAGATVEIITDNVHLHPAIVRMVYTMFPPDHVILVSDSMRATGLQDGVYDLGGQEVRVEGNRANLVHGGAIAGSATNLYDCMKTAIKMGVKPEYAIASASTIPAKRLGIHETMGVIGEGKLANLLVVSETYELEEVYVRGEKRCSI